MATADSPNSAAVLTVRGLTAGYNGRSVVYDVGLNVQAGETVALLGSNGAGKTTTLRAIVGLLPPYSASIHYRGRRWPLGRPAASVKAGLSYIPAERFTFADLTVRENLAVAGHTVADDALLPRRERGLTLFPILKRRLDQRAGTLSGGEQRMLSLAMALMTSPRLLLLDEPSLGLAPAIVDQVTQVLSELVRADRVSVLMVEQNVGQALRIADRAYVMRSGRIIAEEDAATMRARDEWWDLF